MQLSDFELAAKDMVDLLGLTEKEDISINIYMKEDKAKHLAKSISYNNGVYVGENTIASMGGFSFKCDNVKFIINVK